MEVVDLTQTWRDELDTLAEIEARNFGPIAWDKDRLAGGLEASNYVIGMRIDGYLVGNVFVEPDDEVDGYFIWSVATNPEYRGRGIATILMKNVIDTLGHRAIQLMVKTNNATAIRLYERFGFSYVRTQSGAYADGTDGVYMVRSGGHTS